MTTHEGPRVVVGVDPSEHAATALDWAADEAQLRGWPLRIVHARGAGAARLAEVSSQHQWDEADRAARTLLDDTERRAREDRPALPVRTDLVDDAPLPGLIGFVRPEDLLVVGSRGHGLVASLVVGSVSQGLAAHAACPVVVVPDRGASLPGAAVVLGVGPDEAADTVAFAFAEAAWRGAPLLAVRAWSLVSAYPGLATASAEERRGRDEAESEQLDGLLSAAREAHPGVAVRTEISEGAPDAPLVSASEDASLPVLGAQREHARFAPPLGRVVQHVLHQAQCPVALVPHT
ncbi:universal stress protein [Streptacidiphilus melanogenes]|uniref:universal stress protein n=1 Tax=Streptacidiphilus melanogenes TaxID=411235 RepID=UPI0005A947C5|nr:universal stress protein [Streptacidiphilus melanogenes]